MKKRLFSPEFEALEGPKLMKKDTFSLIELPQILWRCCDISCFNLNCQTACTPRTRPGDEETLTEGNDGRKQQRIRNTARICDHHLSVGQGSVDDRTEVNAEFHHHDRLAIYRKLPDFWVKEPGQRCFSLVTTLPFCEHNTSIHPGSHLPDGILQPYMRMGPHEDN